MLLTFGLTLLLSAALLFTVQPLMAKLLLPLLGGSPAVWNTCLVFFQAGLLAGYAYAHALGRFPRLAVQVRVHLVVAALPLLVLPLGLAPGAAPPEGSSPILWLLGTLTVTVGLPFFVLSSTGPLLQRWFAATDHPDARDPYFLYAASNLGSFGGLLAYPFLLEPFLRLTTPGASLFPPRLSPFSQSLLWSAAYLLFGASVAACGGWALTRRRRAAPADASAPAVGAPLTAATRARWVLLALVPSSVLLGVTQHLTADVAAIPLLWVVPLALYLLTFVIAFSPRFRVPLPTASSALAIMAVLAAAALWTFKTLWPWLAFPVHLLTLTAAGVLCHGRLASERPETARLTEFYLWIAVGGVLGGIFNALLAPMIFRGYVEYPIALVLACLLRPESGEEPANAPASLRGHLLDLALPVGIFVVALALQVALSGVGRERLSAVMVFQVGIPAALCLALMGRRFRFALGVAVLLAFGWWQGTSYDDTLHRERTFFGVLRVVRLEAPPFPMVVDGVERAVVVPFHALLHGATRHGDQALEPSMRAIPTTYYHRSGPIGQLFEAFRGSGRLDRVGVVGLGIGTLAAYGEAGMRFTYYEIDPAVVRIARNADYFTFLRDSAATSDFETGDGRLLLARADDGEFGMIVLDAFSSDAIPVHLLTREAVALYRRKLAPGGVLALHLSNRFLVLEHVVGAITEELGMVALLQVDNARTPQDVFEGKDASVWAVMAADRPALEPLAADPRWERLPRGGAGANRRALWTDDHSNLLGVMKGW